MTNKTEILSALDAIDPAELDYQDWLNVGMALKMERFTVDVWEAWSRRDPARYHLGECLKKWESFQGSEHPVTAGTIVAMARSRGWQSAVTGGRILGWDDMIGVGESCSGVVVDQNWVEDRETAEPKVWDPARQLITYLEALFSSEDYVGYVTRSFQKNVDGKQKYFPQKGRFDRTAGKLIEDLEKCNGDIGKVLGDYNPKAGAWIRFNPLDGKDASDKHVTDFRFALVESDTLPIGKQNAILRALELPIAALVHSGGKSLHAIVRVDAVSYEDYRKKVDYLYRICDKNGLILDHQNRNPSRLSRMPGVIRDGEKQFLIDTNLGKASWAEWQEWIESINDDRIDRKCAPPGPQNALGRPKQGGQELRADRTGRLPRGGPSLDGIPVRPGKSLVCQPGTGSGKLPPPVPGRAAGHGRAIQKQRGYLEPSRTFHSNGQTGPQIDSPRHEEKLSCRYH